jgi:hypothetical protein
MKFRTVNGKIRHVVSPIGQARAETKACGGCGYHVCSCVQAPRAVEASPGAAVPCQLQYKHEPSSWSHGLAVRFVGFRAVGISAGGGGGAGISAGGSTATITTGGGGGRTGSDGTASSGTTITTSGYECQIGKYIFRTDPATGHVFWRHADDA